MNPYRLRILAAWSCLRGRPTLYGVRLRTPLDTGDMVAHLAVDLSLPPAEYRVRLRAPLDSAALEGIVHRPHSVLTDDELHAWMDGGS